MKRKVLYDSHWELITMRVTTGHRYFTSKSEGKKTQFLVKGKRKIRNILVGARVRYGTQRVGSKMTPPANTKEKKSH